MFVAAGIVALLLIALLIVTVVITIMCYMRKNYLKNVRKNFKPNTLNKGKLSENRIFINVIFIHYNVSISLLCSRFSITNKVSCCV